MIVRALAVLFVTAAAPPAIAEPAPPPIQIPGADNADRAAARPAHAGRHGQQVFLSPAGEPFRAALGAPYPVAAWFTAADLDHDGALTPAEFSADFDRFFQRLDENHDGVIDGFEVADYEHKIAPEILSNLDRMEEEDEPPAQVGSETAEQPGEGGMTGHGPDGGPPAGGRRGGKPRGMQGVKGAAGAGAIGLLNLPEPVSGADRDFDGKVTLEEWKMAAKARFRLLDRTGEGKLTVAELPLTQAQRLATEKPKPRRDLFGRRAEIRPQSNPPIQP